METQDAVPHGNDTALAAILGNVDRLLDDGDTLIGSGGFASAISLAILAFEECGRAYALRFDLAPSDESTDVRTYHVAAATLGLGFAMLRKYEIDQATFVASVLPKSWDQTRREASGLVAERLRGAIEAALGPMMVALTPERRAELQSDVKGLLEIGKLVRAGGIEALRSGCLRVETDAQGRVLAEPKALSRAMAERWAWAADGVYHLLRGGDHQHPRSLEVAVLMEALGQDRGERRLAA